MTVDKLNGEFLNNGGGGGGGGGVLKKMFIDYWYILNLT